MVSVFLKRCVEMIKKFTDYAKRDLKKDRGYSDQHGFKIKINYFRRVNSVNNKNQISQKFRLCLRVPLRT